MVNPYAPPVDDGAPDAAGDASGRGYHIEGDCLVVVDGTRLPPICVRSGQRARNEHTQTLMWTPVWARLMFGGLAPLLMGKKATFTYFLDDESEHQRTVGKRILLVTLVGGLGLGGLATASELYLLGLVALVALVGGVIYGGRKAAAFRLRRIEDGYIRLHLEPAALAAFAERARRPPKRTKKKKTSAA